MSLAYATYRQEAGHIVGVIPRQAVHDALGASVPLPAEDRCTSVRRLNGQVLRFTRPAAAQIGVTQHHRVTTAGAPKMFAQHLSLTNRLRQALRLPTVQSFPERQGK